MVVHNVWITPIEGVNNRRPYSFPFPHITLMGTGCIPMADRLLVQSSASLASYWPSLSTMFWSTHNLSLVHNYKNEKEFRFSALLTQSGIEMELTRFEDGAWPQHPHA